MSADLHAASGSELRGRTVLVVEDDERLLRLITQVLTRLGMTVLAATDAEEALERLAGAGDRIDVVLSDNVLPGLSGLELFARIRRSHPGIALLLSSGNVVPAPDEARPDEGTPDAILMKPFGLDRLVQTMERILRGD